MWYLANSSKNLFIEGGKLAFLWVIALSIVAELINRYLLGFFFLIKNQAFWYGSFESSRISLLRRSCIIFITFGINA